MAIVAAAALAACGGGSDSTSTTQTTTGVKANTVPVADAGSPQSLVAGSKVSLSAAASSDADGDKLTYAWTLTSKPDGSTAALSDAAALAPTFVADTPGTYVASLVVNDGKASSPAVSVTITASATVAFDSLSPMPPNMPSYGPEAYSFSSLGDRILLKAGSPLTLDTVSVGMSSWACESGDWTNACSTTPNATFNQDITLHVYDSAGNLVGTRTQTFAIPYRPSPDSNCTGTDAGKWQAADGKCYNGKATKITFNLRTLGITLPDEMMSYDVSFNTNTHGPSPIGHTGPYDSLNIGAYFAPTLPSVGVNVDPGLTLVSGSLANLWNESPDVMAQVTTINKQ